MLREGICRMYFVESSALRARSLSSLIRVNLIEIKLRLARSRYRESLGFDRLYYINYLLFSIDG